MPCPQDSHCRSLFSRRFASHENELLLMQAAFAQATNHGPERHCDLRHLMLAGHIAFIELGPDKDGTVSYA